MLTVSTVSTVSLWCYCPLFRAAGLLKERTEDLARLDVRDNGKPIWEAR